MITQFKDIINTPCGIRYFYDQLDIQSSIGRRTLLDMELLTNPVDIETSYASLQWAIELLKMPHLSTSITQKLGQLKDIQGTLNRLQADQILDDIDLYEIKHFALLATEIKRIVPPSDNVHAVVLPLLDTVISLLDPEQQHIATFYVYDAYSEELRQLRHLLKTAPEDDILLFDRMQDLEQQIRTQLSRQLQPYARTLTTALHTLARFDILLAKAKQVANMELCVPQISSIKTSYQGLFHPEVAELLKQKNKQFQRINFSFDDTPNVITGVNMGGKTLILKMLGLCQYLFQFGFGIPAHQAKIGIKQAIYLCIGDDQSIQQGLSSFAAEMLRMNEIIKAGKTTNNLLALVDEPAHTTNPIEGTALVEAFINAIQDQKTALIITTHYTLSNLTCKQFKVMGFDSSNHNSHTTLDQLSAGIDYTLIEVTDGQVPHEALKIASILEVDQQWITEAKKILKDKISHHAK